MNSLHLPGLIASLQLALFAAVAAAALAAMHALTAGPIAQRQAQHALQTLREVLPGVDFDNDLLHDHIERDTATLGKLAVHRARYAGNPVAVVLELTTLDGYSGAITLRIGISSDGRVLGVRVIAHHETPGLGDRIELRHGDWIRGFDGRSLDDPPAAGWTLRKDGGAYDQISGATITAHAVVTAVRRSLEYFASQRESLFAQAAAPPNR